MTMTWTERAMVNYDRAPRERTPIAQAARSPEHLLAARAGVCRVERDGTIHRANQAHLDLLGYSREEYIGRHIAEFHADQSVIENVLASLARGESVDEYPVRMRHKDGSIRCVLVSSVEDGGPTPERCFTLMITEPKRTADAVSESEARFRTLADAVPVLLWMSGRDKQAIYFNQTWLKFTGKPAEEQLGAGWLELVHPEDRQMLHDICLDAFRARRPFTAEFRLRRADGAYRWLLDSGTPRFDLAGAFAGFMGSCVDITDRKEAEDARALLAAVVESSDDAIISKTLDGIIRSWNSGAERLFGYAAEEVVGRPITVIIPPELQDEERSILERLRRGERIEHYETVRISKLGRRIEISLSVSPVRDGDGRIVGASKIARDITDRKQAEEALRRHSEEVQTLLETLPIGVFFAHDPLCRRVTANRAGYELLRMSMEENISKTAPASDQPTHFRTYREGVEIPPERLPVQRAARGELVRDEEIDHVFDDGTVLNLLISAAPLHDEWGRARGAVASALDLTERKRMEQSLREADRRKDEFLAMLAHELRNPLAPIRSGLDILAMDGGGNRETIELMREQVRHLLRLVDDLLDVSRIMRGKTELRREPVELSVLIDRSVEAVRALSGSHAPELIVALPEHPIWLDADPVRLVQVIGNLLNNAFKYTDAGGRIELTAESREGQAVISLRDTGIGIEPDLLPNVFDLFMQSSRSLDRAQGGLGIGLTLVQRLVELHGGSVSADSEGPGHGSTFTVRLPLAEFSRQVGETGRPPRLARRRRILVVDDNVGAAKMLSLLLTRLGDHEIEIAHDGLSALAKARALCPDIILLDIGLPGMDGYQVARALRETGEFDSVLLVALTGYGQEEDRQRSQEAGFDRHLVKPAETSELAKLLAEPRSSDP